MRGCGRGCGQEVVGEWKGDPGVVVVEGALGRSWRWKRGGEDLLRLPSRVDDGLVWVNVLGRFCCVVGLLFGVLRVGGTGRMLYGGGTGMHWQILGQIVQVRERCLVIVWLLWPPPSPWADCLAMRASPLPFEDHGVAEPEGIVPLDQPAHLVSSSMLRLDMCPDQDLVELFAHCYAAPGCFVDQDRALGFVIVDRISIEDLVVSSNGVLLGGGEATTLGFVFQVSNEPLDRLGVWEGYNRAPERSVHGVLDMIV